MMRLRFLAFFLALWATVNIPLLLMAQNMPSLPKTGTIEGQVRLTDGRPASMGIAVYLEQRGGGTADQTLTDRQGRFSFHPEIALYVVTLRAPGYLTEQQEVNLNMMAQAYIEFRLRPDPKALASPEKNAPPSGTLSALDAKAPADARKNVQEGESLLASGKNINKSISLFKKAIERYPQYVQAYVLMGVAYSSQQKWDEAEKSLKKALELDKLSAAALVALGALENEKQNFVEAQKYLNQAVDIAPQSADAQFELARAYWGLGNWQDADPHVTKALQLRPDHSGEHLLMGNIMLRKRDAPGALKQFQESLRLDPKGPFAGPTKQIIEKIQNALKAAQQQ